MEPHLNRALTKTEQVYERLRGRAKYGKLRPLRRLKPADLDRHLRSGLTPARDALLRLHIEGYVRSDAGRGYWTKPYRMKEQIDLQTMLLMNTVYCMDAAGRSASEGLRAAADQFRSALAAASGLAGEAPASAHVEAQDEFLRQAADLSGSDIIPKLVRNAIDRTHFPRVLDAEDAQVAARVANHLHAMCAAALAHDLQAAVSAGSSLAGEWAARLDAIVDRANALIADERFP